ncbi:type II toxin-antitoxin system HicB family antitoxin [Candidatus Gracilibacteria bacterium 28_42_T64]|nr:type II toxin-antitoxin system HicB family antitoxin [Candidatus Gracilibacteria bacterium 28_42_T64]
MLTEFIEGAMKKSKYEILEGGEGFYGEIEGFSGVWAESDTLEGCRSELKEVLEEWILIKVRKHTFIPKVESYDINDLICEK